jgi:Cu+-exporting ATPase
MVERAAELQAAGKTVLFVAVDGRAAGLLAVADPIKETTREAVADLHQLGIQIVMATGDNRRTAEAVAKQLGLDRVESEVEPADKIRLVQSLKQQGTHVAMAGDGI